MLKEELANQSQEFLSQQGVLMAEAGALRGKLEKMQRERDGETRSSAELLRRTAVMVTMTRCVVTELQGAAEQKANLLEEARTHVETLRRGERPPPKLLHLLHSTIDALNVSPPFLLSLLELEHLKVELQSRDDEEQQQQQEEDFDKENLPDEEQRTLTVVEELKEELQQFHKRRKVETRQQDEEEAHQSRAFAAVQREIERQEARSEAPLQVSLTPGHQGGAALLLQTANCLVSSRLSQRCGRRVRLPQLDVCVSPLTSNTANKRRSLRTTGRKRKSCEVEVGARSSSTPEGGGC